MKSPTPVRIDTRVQRNQVVRSCPIQISTEEPVGQFQAGSVETNLSRTADDYHEAERPSAGRFNGNLRLRLGECMHGAGDRSNRAGKDEKAQTHVSLYLKAVSYKPGNTEP